MKNDIRFLLTQSCNYNCYFCHHEGMYSCRSVTTEFSVQDYVTLYSVYSNLEGWNGVTLSGGEPLLFKDILELVKALHKEGAEITLVTNGYFLLEHMDVLKYLKRINISLHTTREADYNNIVQRKNVLGKVLKGLQVASEIFPNLKIRLNVTPTKSNNWSSNLLKELIEYAKQINASIKFTELFPNTDDDCVSIASMEEELTKLGYKEQLSYGRTRKFEKDICVYLTQCTCSKAMLTSNPIEYCRQNHDLYVNHTGRIMLCRLAENGIDVLEDVKEKNIPILQMKIKIAQRRISRKQCYKILGITK